MTPFATPNQFYHTTSLFPLNQVGIQPPISCRTYDELRPYMKKLEYTLLRDFVQLIDSLRKPFPPQHIS
jgi:hypothetical protein